MLVPLAFSIISLCCFLTGICLAVFELSDVLPSVLATSLGLIGLFISAGLWLTAPTIFKNPHSSSISTIKRRRNYIISKNLNKSNSHVHLAETSMLITPDTTVALMKSIRGIPFLIQAIQYSLETNYYTDVMNELGQSILGNSVIHTAPGCTSALDHCDSDDEHHATLGPLQTPSPRLSGPEEQWEATTKNRWSNPQLRLSLNRRTSALLANVFPYSESRPVESFDESINETVEEGDSVSGRPSIGESDSAIPIIKHFRPTLNGSQQSQLSRVTVSHTSLPSHEVRCIGMSGALLTRFNSSFKSNSTE